MKAKVILSYTKRIIPELIDISIPEYIENIERYVLDTRGMKYETRKIFEQ